MLSTINILNNKKCQIITEDVDLLKKIHRLLSFKNEGVEYTAAYRDGSWDGFTYMLSKAGKFELGLLPKVQGFLESKNYDYQVIDKRTIPAAVTPLDISENLKKHGLIPRAHQEKILNAVCNNERGIVRAATGSGKTLSIAIATAKLNKPTIIYVIGLDLLQQFHDLFSKLFNEKIGYIGDGTVDPARITIASIWTIGRALKLDAKSIIDSEETLLDEDFDETNNEKIVRCIKEAKIHFFDESHVCATNTIATIYKNIDPERIYGFSGTPFKNVGNDLVISGVLGEIIVNVSASELIEKGILAKPIIKFVTVPKVHLESSGQYLSVYKEYIVENETRNNLIINHAKELLQKGYVPLLLFKQIKHGEIIYQKLLDSGMPCDILHGNDSLERRQEIKNRLINGEIKAIVASTIFDIGLDLPLLSGLILCGGGKSTVRALQRIGRVIRMITGKKFAAIIDFYDQAKYLKSHSKIRCEVYESEPGFKVIKSKEMKK